MQRQFSQSFQANPSLKMISMLDYPKYLIIYHQEISVMSHLGILSYGLIYIRMLSTCVKTFSLQIHTPLS